MGPPQMVGGCDKIGNIRRKTGVPKFTFAGAYPCKVKTEDTDTVVGKRMGNATRREIILATREAMGKQSVTEELTRWAIECRGETEPACIGKVESLNWHVSSKESCAQVTKGWAPYAASAFAMSKRSGGTIGQILARLFFIFARTAGLVSNGG
jgi:hypothetical protein